MNLWKYILAVLVLGAFVTAAAQTRPQDPWVQVNADADLFQVSMPHQPNTRTIEKVRTDYGGLEVNGKLYLSLANGAIYNVWALTNRGDWVQQREDYGNYLDETAELVWEGLLKPLRDTLPDEQKESASMSYTKELRDKPIPGREYSVTIGNMTGTTQFFPTEGRVFVLLAMGPAGGDWIREPFFGSFTVSSLAVPKPLDVTATGIGPGVAVRDDAGRIFRSSEVDARARVTHKPEPTYTESARKFSITGRVVLRCVFSKDGEVTNLLVIEKLPHGLTRNAVEAARKIRFTPAVKDGQPVSIWMQLEYNFNLY